jgi:hypothetical protein
MIKRRRAGDVFGFAEVAVEVSVLIGSDPSVLPPKSGVGGGELVRARLWRRR